MYFLNIHAKPTEESDQFDKVLGAYVSVYIDFKDIDGAFELAKLYTQEQGWAIDEVEKDYLDKQQQKINDENYKRLLESYTITIEPPEWLDKDIKLYQDEKD